MTCDMTGVVIGILNVRWRGKISRSESEMPLGSKFLSLA